MTHAFLEVSQKTYEEIKAKLLAAGYNDKFLWHYDGKVAIYMNGIALVPEPVTPPRPT